MTSKPWKLFIDDERWPKDDGWVIIRSSFDAIQEIKERGMPEEIAFDHDLGIAVDENDNEYCDTTMRLVWWIIDSHLDGTLEIPSNFTFSVHSQNPVGARNIQETLEAFLKSEGIW